MPIHGISMSIFAKVTVYLSLFASLVLLAACGEQASEIPAEATLRPVKSVVVNGTGSSKQWHFPGKVRAFEKVDLSFQVSGQLTQLNVLSGQEVKAGHILAELDQRNFASDAKAAQAELDRASAEFNRMGPLLEKRLVSQSEFDQKRAQRDIAEARLEQAKKALDDTQLKAPFDGVIANRSVENFEDITAKQTIMSLQNPEALEVIINIPENRIVELDAERDFIQSFASTTADPSKQYALDLREYSTEVDPATQTYEAILNLIATEEDRIFSGMSVDVLLTSTRKQSDTFWLPASAVIADRENIDTKIVWVLSQQAASEQYQVSKREITIGKLENENIEILTGINSGERIVTAGSHYLRNGDLVKLYQGEDF